MAVERVLISLFLTESCRIFFCELPLFLLTGIFLCLEQDKEEEEEEGENQEEKQEGKICVKIKKKKINNTQCTNNILSYPFHIQRPLSSHIFKIK